MTVSEFIGKWRGHELTERSAAQQHFIDLCRVVDHPTPAEVDRTGESFTFERGAAKATGGDGWADVWKKEFFGWEYKSRSRDLDAAYLQLLKYQGALENPPLLITSDTDRIVIHTHFANTPTRKIELTLEGLANPDQLATLRAVFHEPDRLRPNKTIKAITEEAAEKITTIAHALSARGLPPDRIARFLDRVVFCLFAEDVRLLPNKVFTRLIENTQGLPDRFRLLTGDLFAQMANGGNFGADRIDYFNGNLFDTIEALELTVAELRQLYEVSQLDWSNIDASIFGTLFERALDPDKRTQLGAHYTSREDIEALVNPVVMAPLKAQWSAVRKQFDILVEGSPSSKEWKDARILIRGFLDRLAAVTVLDPACGSGNFLYVSLQKLKDLEKEVIIHASAYFPFFPQVGPWQLRGIEINPYAHDLAQMTVWIGHLQWHDRHGMPLEERPILRPMENFERKDAVLNFGPLLSTEPQWPDAEFIVSNPPFLGVRKMRENLGSEYVDKLFDVWGDRVPPESDYCCYWFEKAREQIRTGKTVRVGLLATQGIRSGASMQVIRRIKTTGEIFFAISDREWSLDGAMVHVSMIGFDNGTQKERTLDGIATDEINPNLTTGTDVTTAGPLHDNVGISFMGDTKGGAFDIPMETALQWMHQPNPNGSPNSDVLRPWVNGMDITRRSRGMWIIDYPPGTTKEQAALYEAVFEHLRRTVEPVRRTNRRAAYADRWWMHVEPRPEMRRRLTPLQRYIGTPNVTRHRLFAWLPPEVLADHQLIVFASDDEYLFGVLHSKVHELWARANGSQLREEESGFRYTPTSTFETFPLPKPDEDQRQSIVKAVQELDALRRRWLNPPEWTIEQTLIFPARAKGIWGRFVTGVNAEGIGTARYSRLQPVNEDAGQRLRRRTLTNLYNESPAWLQDAHRTLDGAVLAAYGWDVTISDYDIVARLLALNRQSHVIT